MRNATYYDEKFKWEQVTRIRAQIYRANLDRTLRVAVLLSRSTSLLDRISKSEKNNDLKASAQAALHRIEEVAGIIENLNTTWMKSLNPKLSSDALKKEVHELFSVVFEFIERTSPKPHQDLGQLIEGPKNLVQMTGLLGAVALVSSALIIGPEMAVNYFQCQSIPVVAGKFLIQVFGAACALGNVGLGGALLGYIATQEAIPDTIKGLQQAIFGPAESRMQRRNFAATVAEEVQVETSSRRTNVMKQEIIRAVQKRCEELFDSVQPPDPSLLNVDALRVNGDMPPLRRPAKHLVDGQEVEW